jgi:hypothetical protein
LTHGKKIFAIVTGASDAAAAASSLSEMRFDVTGELCMVLPALPGTIVLLDRQGSSDPA